MNSKTLSQSYLSFAASLKNFAARNRMLTKPEINGSVPFAYAMQIFLSVISFGFLLGAMPLARQYPLGGLVLGVCASAGLFLLTRAINAIVNPLFEMIDKTTWISFPAGMLLILVYLVAYLAAPATVLWVAAQLIPAFVHPVREFDAYFVLVGDFLIGGMTGIRLYLPTSHRKDESTSDDAKR